VVTSETSACSKDLLTSACSKDLLTSEMRVQGCGVQDRRRDKVGATVRRTIVTQTLRGCVLIDGNCVVTEHVTLMLDECFVRFR
jgi:hypothetical protein